MTSVKEKVNAIQSVVKGYSNHEIVLVLQHYDEDLELAIADFMVPEKIKAILTEWQSTGPTKPKKKKKKKAKKLKQELSTNNDAMKEIVSVEDSTIDNNNLVNGDEQKKELTNESDILAAEPVLTSSIAVSIAENAINPTNTKENHVIGETEKHTEPIQKSVNHVTKPVEKRSGNDMSQTAKLLEGEKHRRTTSESSSHSHHVSYNRNKHKTHHKHNDGNNSHNQQAHTQILFQNRNNNKKSIEKAAKDLQRCSVSFGRYRNLLNDEITESYKRIKQAFEELSNAIMDREVVLLRNLDEIKEEAFLLLSKREARAAQLKQQTEKVGNMNPQQLADLRNDIKHFVAERKFDEEIGRTTRFVYDKEFHLKLIPDFGKICDVKNQPSLISRIRTESASSFAAESSPAVPVVVEKEPPKQQRPEKNRKVTTKVNKVEKIEVKDVQGDLKKPIGKSSTTNEAVASNWADESNHLVPLSPSSWANETEKTNNFEPKKNFKKFTNKQNENRQQRRYGDNREKPKEKTSNQHQQGTKIADKQQNNFQHPRQNFNYHDQNSNFGNRPRNYPRKDYVRDSVDSSKSFSRNQGNYQKGDYQNYGGQGRSNNVNNFDNRPPYSSNKPNFRHNSNKGFPPKNKPKDQPTDV